MVSPGPATPATRAPHAIRPVPRGTPTDARRWRLALGWGAAVTVTLLVSAREAAGLFVFYRTHARLPLWDMAEHGWQALVIARDLQDGRLWQLLVDLNRQDTWPFGYSLLVAPLLLVGGGDFAAATLSSAVLFAVAPALLLAVARELDDGPVGLGAGILAASLFVVSPVLRLFAILVMRELAGVALTLLAFHFYLRAVRRESLALYRASGAAALTLFFVKYNYAVLWLLGVAVHQFGRLPAGARAALGRRIAAWVWPWPTRQPRRALPALALYGLLGLAVVGRGVGPALYAVLVGGAALWVWRLGRHPALVRARWRALPPPARAGLETLVMPLWLWALSPSPLHVRKLLGFLVNRGTGLPALSLDALSFYGRSFVHDYAADWRIGTAVLVAAAVSAVGLWRAGEPYRALILVIGVQVAAATVHPYKAARFFVTTAPLVMLLASVGVARAVARLAGPTRGWLVSGVPAVAAAALLIGGLAGPEATARLAARYSVQSADPALAAPLRYIDEHAPRTGRVAVVGAFAELSPGLIRWTLALTRDIARFGVVKAAGRLAPDAPAEEVRRAAEVWVGRRPPDMIVGIRVLPSSPYYGTDDFQAFNAWQLRVLDEVAGDVRWRRVDARRFPESGLEIVVFAPGT